MFQQLLAKNLYYMHQMAFVYHSEEAVRDGSALKEQEELLKKEKDEKLQEEFESLRQEKKRKRRGKRRTIIIHMMNTAP